MSEAKTYLGASSRHAYCENYEFANGVPLKMFNRDETFETITWLDVQSCTGTLYLDTFKNLPKLEILNFKNCNFDAMNSCFKNLKCLRSMDIWKSQLLLNLCTFDGCKSLNNLRLINCEELEINEDSFSEIPNLEYLMIQRNKFSVGENLFAHLENLKYLTLQTCEIDFETKEPFKYLKNLSFLSINNCVLKNINFDAFSLLYKLETILLNDNQFEGAFNFQNFKNLPSLNTVSFPFQDLEKLDFSEFRNLKTVQFELTHENAAELMNKLKKLGASYEWFSSGEIPEFDKNDPNIQICA